jgi:flagellar hook-associated protein 3 FlgL
MSIASVSTNLFNTQASGDLRKVQAELADLQRQIGSGNKADDLKGYGVESTRILSAQTLISRTDARKQAADTLSGRLDAVDTALSASSDAVEALRQAVLTALGQDDGRYLTNSLQTAFDQTRTALNTNFEGEALFGGERIGGDPINVTTLAALAAAPSTSAIFDEATRTKTVDLGDGPFSIGEKASDFSTGAFDAMRQLKLLIDGAGGSLPQPLTAGQRASLQTIADSLNTSRQTILVSQGRNGDLQNTVEAKSTALGAQSDALTKLKGGAEDADLGEVATKISAFQVQYQAVAQTFAMLSHMSLLDYLSA